MDNQDHLVRRIEELQGAAQKVRLEAMKLAAAIVTKSNALLTESAGNTLREAELALLKARYEGLVRTAEQAQSQIDWLQAEEHRQKYYR